MNKISIVNGILAEPGLTGKDLMENRAYNPSPFAYQRDDKFIRISMGNFRAYTILARTEDFTFAVSPGGSGGYVFDGRDIAMSPRIGMVPVMTVQLRESRIKAYRRALRLHIREAYAERSIAIKWYVAYANMFGGIITDAGLVEGGWRLWRPFVETATAQGLKISLVNKSTGDLRLIDASICDSELWSSDDKLKPMVLEKS